LALQLFARRIAEKSRCWADLSQTSRICAKSFGPAWLSSHDIESVFE
jgi:hypothetical protein